MADERKYQRTPYVPGKRGTKATPGRESPAEQAAKRTLADLEAIAASDPALRQALKVHIDDARANVEALRERRRVRQFETPVTARSGVFAGVTFASRADLAQTRRDELRAQELWRAGRVKEAKVIGRTLLRKLHMLTGDRDNWRWLIGEWQGS